MYQLLGGIRRVWSTIISPFQRISYGVRNVATNNPITMAGRYARSQGQQLQYYRQLPQSMLDRFIPRSWRKRLGLGDPSVKQQALDETGKPIDEATKAMVEGARRNTRRGAPPQTTTRPPRRMPWLIRKAEFSQIHLIDSRTGAREVYHIGGVIGQSKIELTLQSATVPPNPVVVRFTQADPAIHKAPMLITYVSGKDAVQIKGRIARPTLPLEPNAVIEIGGATYTCELYAWNRLAAVTRVDAAFSSSLGVGTKGYDRNEDAIGVAQHKRGYLFAVADGVGSGYAPDEVSAYATKYLLSAFKRNIRRPVDWSSVLTKTFDHINREVRHFSRKIENENEKGATTLTAVVIRSWEANVAHIGDSRLYLLREGKFDQMTKDDAIEEERENSVNNPAHPKIKVQRLTGAIGRDLTIHPTVFSFRLQPQDRLLLCTDGVTRYVRPARIQQLMQTEPLSRLPETLIRESAENGSHDNISVIAVQVLEHAYPRDNWKATATERVFVGNGSWSLRMKHPNPQFQTQYWTSQQRGCVTAAAVIVVLFALLWGILRLTNRTGEDVASARTRIPRSGTSIPITLQPEQIDLVRGFFGLDELSGTESVPDSSDQANGSESVNPESQATESLEIISATSTTEPATPTLEPTEIPPTLAPPTPTYTRTPGVTSLPATPLLPTSTLRPPSTG